MWTFFDSLPSLTILLNTVYVVWTFGKPPSPCLVHIVSHFPLFSDLDVGQSTEFNCDSDANPPAQFEWLQKISDRNDKSKRGQVYSRGQGKTLILKNVTYENEGKWVCVATNSIRGIISNSNIFSTFYGKKSTKFDFSPISWKKEPFYTRSGHF